MSLILSAQLLAMLKGLATGASLIIAIGAQNAFVLTQGLRRQHHWPVAAVCSFFDAVFILLGVTGMGLLIADSPTLMQITRWGGALFLGWYGLQALRSALSPHTLVSNERGAASLRAALLTTLAITLLNPHVYLDTVVLIGSIGGQYAEDQRYWFAAGAILFSCIWFSLLSFGARWLAPLFARPIAWRILDGIVALMMWSIAVSLLWTS